MFSNKKNLQNWWSIFRNFFFFTTFLSFLIFFLISTKPVYKTSYQRNNEEMKSIAAELTKMVIDSPEETFEAEF